VSEGCVLRCGYDDVIDEGCGQHLLNENGRKGGNGHASKSRSIYRQIELGDGLGAALRGAEKPRGCLLVSGKTTLERRKGRGIVDGAHKLHHL
jgi:hypothetical protein